jgi:hypothetical protein
MVRIPSTVMKNPYATSIALGISLREFGSPIDIRVSFPHKNDRAHISRLMDRAHRPENRPEDDGKVV